MPLMVYLYIYNKKDDDTSKEIQEMPVRAYFNNNNTVNKSGFLKLNDIKRICS